MKKVIFTDLDGTLLSWDDYGWRGAEPALGKIKERHVPLIFSSAKTRAEQEFYQEAIGIRDPFIVENGAAIFIHQGTFPFPVPSGRGDGRYQVIELGLPIAEVRRMLDEVRQETGVAFQGYGVMPVSEVARLTGLEPAAAGRAMQRGYDETIRLEADQRGVERVRQALARRGASIVYGGLLMHVMKGGDKGKAVRILTDLYRGMYGEVETLGIGDSPNDEPLLAAVDRPFLMTNRDGVWESLAVPGLQRVEGGGPAAWNELVLSLLD